MSIANAPPLATVVEEADSLQCPYHGCDGLMTPGSEAVACPRCHRLAARCPCLIRGARCRALNRPLAAFCRYCGQKLHRQWAQEHWLRDLPDGRGAGFGHAGGSARLVLKKPLGVLSLDQWTQLMPQGRLPMELVEAGGRLWIGGQDGTYLFVDPLRQDPDRPPDVRLPLWPEDRTLRVRAVSSGLWLVMFSKRGLRAVNLIGLDDGQASNLPTLDVWSSSPQQRLLSDPVILDDVGNGLTSGPENDSLTHDRTIAWVSGEPKGELRLCWATLSATGARPEVHFQPILLKEGPPLALEAGVQRVVLISAMPLKDRTGLVLCTGSNLYVIGFRPHQPQQKPTAYLLHSRPVFAVNWQELPGVVFLPAREPLGDEGGTWGTVFLPWKEEAASSIHRLCAVVILGNGRVTTPDYPKGGIPVGVFQDTGATSVLCVSGQSLVCHDRMQRTSDIGESRMLEGVVRGHVHGRLAVFSGATEIQGQPRWFVQVWDLRKRAILESVEQHTPPAHPLVIGRWLFRVEEFTPEGSHASRGEFYLTRREIAQDTPIGVRPSV